MKILSSLDFYLLQGNPDIADKKLSASINNNKIKASYPFVNTNAKFIDFKTNKKSNLLLCVYHNDKATQIENSMLDILFFLELNKRENGMYILNYNNFIFVYSINLIQNTCTTSIFNYRTDLVLLNEYIKASDTKIFFCSTQSIESKLYYEYTTDASHDKEIDNKNLFFIDNLYPLLLQNNKNIIELNFSMNQSSKNNITHLKDSPFVINNILKIKEIMQTLSIFLIVLFLFLFVTIIISNTIQSAYKNSLNDFENLKSKQELLNQIIQNKRINKPDCSELLLQLSLLFENPNDYISYLNITQESITADIYSKEILVLISKLKQASFSKDLTIAGTIDADVKTSLQKARIIIKLQ